MSSTEESTNVPTEKTTLPLFFELFHAVLALGNDWTGKNVELKRAIDRFHTGCAPLYSSGKPDGIALDLWTEMAGAIELEIRDWNKGTGTGSLPFNPGTMWLLRNWITLSVDVQRAVAWGFHEEIENMKVLNGPDWLTHHPY